MKKILQFQKAIRREEEEPVFLEILRERMEETLLSDAADAKKITVGDYLKVVALLEESRKTSRSGIGEVVVRWADRKEIERRPSRKII